MLTCDPRATSHKMPATSRSQKLQTTSCKSQASSPSCKSLAAYKLQFKSCKKHKRRKEILMRRTMSKIVRWRRVEGQTSGTCLVAFPLPPTMSGAQRVCITPTTTRPSPTGSGTNRHGQNPPSWSVTVICSLHKYK